MKKLLCLALSFVFVCFSCAKPKTYENFRIGLTKAQAELNSEEIYRESGDIALGFAASLIKNSNEGNALAAPLAALTALSIAENGAAGDTLAQFEAALGASMATISEYCLAASEEIDNFSGKTKMSAASSLWIKESYKEYVKQDYLSEISRYFGPEIFALPFDKKAINNINNWVYNRTGGRIKNIAEGFSKDEVIDIISAAYVEGKWSEAAKDTRKNIFFSESGETTAEYFSGSSALYESENAYLVKRTMEGGVCFAAIMPKGDFVEYLSSLSGGELSALLGTVNPRGATYSMPEFKTEYSASLIPTLRKMGINDAFSKTVADFSGMTDHPDGLYISAVLMKTNIDVNKNGLKAAAAVKVSMDNAMSAAPESEKPLHIDFNKPFLYMLLTPNGAPLFIGKLLSPAENA